MEGGARFLPAGSRKKRPFPDFLCIRIIVCWGRFGGPPFLETPLVVSVVVGFLRLLATGGHATTAEPAFV